MVTSVQRPSRGGRAAREWVLLLHRLPREPSAPRIALWRALRRLGALLLGDGIVALPSSARTIEHLEWLAVGIIEQGGSASVWVARPLGRIDSELADHGRQASEDEYAALEREAREAVDADPAEVRRRLARLRRELRKAEARDYFGARNRARARAAVDRLACGGVTA